MDSDSDSDVSRAEGPTQDLAPPVDLTDTCYTAAWIPDATMKTVTGAALLRGYFLNEEDQKVLVYVPTEAVWQLAKSTETKEILKTANLYRFFKLRPWGPDIRRAWELQKSLTKDGQATFTGFDGHPIQVTIDAKTIRDALHFLVGVSLPTGNLTRQERRLASARDRPTFAQLTYPQITLPLQLYMQFFGMSLTQRYTVPELRIAVLLAKAFEDPDLLTYDLSEMILKNIMRINESKSLAGQSHAKRPLPQYLGAPLVLTRIAYAALDVLQHLPPPYQQGGEVPYLPRPHKLASPKAPRKRKQIESSEDEPPGPKKMRGTVQEPSPKKTAQRKEQVKKKEQEPMPKPKPTQEKDNSDYSSDWSDHDHHSDDDQQYNYTQEEQDERLLQRVIDEENRKTAADDARRAKEAEDLEAATQESLKTAKAERKRAMDAQRQAEEEFRRKKDGAGSSSAPQPTPQQQEQPQPQPTQRPDVIHIPESPPKVHREGKAPVFTPTPMDITSLEPPPFTQLSAQELEDAKVWAEEDTKKQFKRAKQKSVVQGYSVFTKNADDIMTQYVDIMRDEGMRAANKVSDSQYLRDMMRKAVTTMTELSMAVMYTDQMHISIEELSKEKFKENAEALLQAEHMRDQALQRSEFFATRLQAQLQDQLKTQEEIQLLKTEKEHQDEELKLLREQLPLLQAKADEATATVRHLEDEVKRTNEDYWTADQLMRLAQQQLSVSERSLKIAMDRPTRSMPAAQSSSQASVESAQITEELERCKQLIEAQRLENFSMMSELMAMKAEMAVLKATPPPPPLATQESARSPIRPVSEHVTSPQRPPIEMPPLSYDEHREWRQDRATPSWYDLELEQRKDEVNKKGYELDKTVYDVTRRYWPVPEALSRAELPRYVLKCKIRDETSSYLRRFKTPEEMPGYNPVDVKDWKKKEVMEGQPEWRLEFFRKNPAAIKIYAQAPRDLRIDPTYCPLVREHSWDAFDRFYAKNPNAMNWPALPQPPEGQPITETWFLEACEDINNRLHDIPDLSCRMLCKFVRLFMVCMQTFKEVEKERTDWHRYAEPDRGLAFDFAIGPEEFQQWGYYARLQHLPSHYMNTWEEMTLSEFLPSLNRIFSPHTEPLTTRFLAFKKAQMNTPGGRLHYTTEEVQRARDIFDQLQRPKPSRGRSGRGRGE